MSYISSAMSPDKKHVLVWDRDKDGKRFVRKHKCEYYFYVPCINGDFNALNGDKLKRLEFRTYTGMRDAKKEYKVRGIQIYESDIANEYKVISNYYYGKPQGTVHFTLYDIEVDYLPEKGFAGPKNPYGPISSISIYHEYSKRMVVYATPSPKFKDITMDDVPQEIRDNVELILCKNEAELLNHFMCEIEDSDIISGWNSDGYDTPYIYERLKTVFGQHRANELSFPGAPKPYYREVVGEHGRVDKVLVLSGRISVDLMLLFKNFEQVNRPSYALEIIADEFLPDLPKLSYSGTLYDLYHKDFFHFLRYSKRDTEILKGLEDILGYVQVAINMAQLSGSNVNDVLGTIKMAAQSIVNFAHLDPNFMVIMPDKGPHEEVTEKFTGALVLKPQVGMHRWITSIDLASLYPMAIISLNASPETLVGQFLENEVAHEAIFKKYNTLLLFRYENGDIEEMTAQQWRQKCKDNNWSVSGFGTVFSMDKLGVVPALLLSWYKSRKEFKKKRDDALREIELLEKNSNPDLAKIKKLKEYANYCDKIQYIKKIQLNSFYGAIGNQWFKLFDIRIAESTTRTGRGVLMHMVRKIAELLDGEYTYPSDSSIYSDTDSVAFNSIIEIDGIKDTIESWFNKLAEEHGRHVDGEKEFTKISSLDLHTPTYDVAYDCMVDKPLMTIYRHKIEKKMYTVTSVDGHSVTTTADHSLMVMRGGNIIEIIPTDILSGDQLVIFE